MSLMLEHNGHELRFREDDESWYCTALNLKASSLRALKAKITKLDGVTRKVAVPALLVEYRATKTTQGQIVMIAKAKDREKEWQRSQSVPVPTVWMNVVRGNKIERLKVRLDRCIAPTTENLVLLDAVKAKVQQAEALEEEAETLLASIPRITLEDLTAKGAEEDNLDEEATA